MGATTAIDYARQRERGRGRGAVDPTAIPPAGWKDVLWRTWQQINEDRVTLIGAGVTYYLLLALFPTLTAFISIYGLFTDPATAQAHAGALYGILPAGGVEVISEQLTRLTSQRGSTLGFALVISLAIALWSASAGVKALFEVMNVAFEETEKRNFLVLNLQALAFTLAGIVGAVAAVAIVVVLPAILGLLGLSRGFEWLAQGLGYLLLAALLFAGIAALYRFGPSREQAKWRWITPGAILAVLLILGASALFSWYAANFGRYEETYGSLGALIALLTWIWISVLVVIAGAELNAESEHQTARDSTTGSEQPLGLRQATMADTVGAATDGEIMPADRPGRRESAHHGGPAPALAVGLVLALALVALETRGRRDG